MKFKVGDKVRIKKDLSIDKTYGITVVSSMEKYAGRIMTVSRITNFGYRLKEDNEEWHWSEDTMEIVPKPTKEELLKMPLGTIIKTDKEGHNIFVKVGENDFCNNDYDHIEYDNIKEDLSLDYYEEGKIIEIQEPNYTTIYKEDKQVKEMTIAEIEKELGYPIKVVKED